MPINWKKIRLSVQLLGVFFLLSGSNMANENKDLVSNLSATLKTFAKSNGLSHEQLQSLVGQIVLNSQTIAKGGVGTIGDSERYVLVDGEQNGVLIDGTEWKGASSAQEEVVVIGKHGVLGSVKVPEGELAPTVIVFFQKEVRYIDLSKNTGAKYLRHASPASKVL